MTRSGAAVKDFEKLDIRVVEVQPFSKGWYSTHILLIDFGPGLGIKKSLAKLAPNYDGEKSIGRLFLAVVSSASTSPRC